MGRTDADGPSKDERNGMAAALADDLAPMGAVEVRAMFGGHGLFRDGVMFAMLDSGGVARLRGDDAFGAELEAQGAQKFDGRMPYWSIPDTIRGDTAELVACAERAHGIAVATKKPKKARKAKAEKAT